MPDIYKKWQSLRIHFWWFLLLFLWIPVQPKLQYSLRNLHQSFEIHRRLHISRPVLQADLILGMILQNHSWKKMCVRGSPWLKSVHFWGFLFYNFGEIISLINDTLQIVLMMTTCLNKMTFVFNGLQISWLQGKLPLVDIFAY